MSADATNVAGLIADLNAEQGVLDAIVEPLDAPQWLLPTPSPRWT